MYEAHIMKTTHPRFTDSSSFKNPVYSQVLSRPRNMETISRFLKKCGNRKINRFTAVVNSSSTVWWLYQISSLHCRSLATAKYAIRLESVLQKMNK